MLAFQTSFEDAPRLLLVLQALYDLLPVALFLWGGIILLRCLYPKMVKGNYVLLGAGSIMVFVAGFFKAMRKFLLATARIDYLILDYQFTSTQSVGFALLAIALIGMFTPYNKHHLEHPSSSIKAKGIYLPFLSFGALAASETSSSISEYHSTLPFIVLMVLGATTFLIFLMIISGKMKQIPAMIFFLLSILFMVGMGYLSTKRYFEAAWIQISCNVCYQICFLVGCLFLQKHGLEKANLFSTKTITK